MDFDEYDYLEKTSENPETLNAKDAAVNGSDKNDKSGEQERRRSSKHRGEENNDRGLKRSRHGEEGGDRDRHREKGSSRHRSRSRDGERVEKDRHRSSRDHADRDRDRDREEMNGKGRDRDRERDREPDRSRKESVREKKKETDPERRRSRSHSVRQSERDEKDRARSRDRELKEKEREKELREREIRRHKEKKEERTEPEVDPERDQRTVFAYQICLKADERDVYEFFSRAGKVRDVRLIMDRNSRRSKGVGYIEFYDVMSVPMAIAMSGQPLLGTPVMVKPSEAEKNLVQSTTTAGPGGQIGPYSGGARRLYVGNLHFNITEDQLRQVFEPFGTVELVQLPHDETGHCKGFGFVQFARLEDSRAAQSLDGQIEIAGRPIKVSAITDQVGMLDTGANAADFDDDEGGGLSLNARSRAMLMQKLDRSGTATISNPGLSLPMPPMIGNVPGMSSLVASLVQPSIPTIPGFAGAVDAIGTPSECLMLNNMFDPTAESEPEFDLDIKEDVEDECSKFGKVKHIFVDKNSAGFVYLRFDSTQAAMGAQRALHGRWFAGKMITASFMVPANYEAKFPDSR